MIALFDLDGTLINSRQTIIDAYGLANITAPTDILEQAETGWLEAMVGTELAPQIRAEKNEHYLRLLQSGHAPLLPSFQTAQSLRQDGNFVGLMTGAPKGSVKALCRSELMRHQVWPFVSVTEAASTERKMQQLSYLGDHGVYIDDQARLVNGNIPDGWTFIHYVGQDSDTLLKEVNACVYV